MVHRLVLILLAVAVTVGVAGCGTAATDTGDSQQDGDEPVAAEQQEPDAGAPDDGDVPSGSSAYAWLDTRLTDAVTGESFRISDFAGEPVLIQGFAVW